ncbi:MAG: hypothetical protein ACJA2N_000892 [Salibacteraceae bacterium]|jgi:hypothetical protein
MKFLSIFLFSLIGIFGHSQITIDMDDLPQPGQSYYRSTGTSNSLDPGQTGANYTWDYTDLQRSNRDTLLYDAISQTPIFYQFQFNSPLSPNYKATEARYTEDIDLGGFIQMTNNYLFSKTDPNSWTEVGIGTTITGLPLPTKYSDIKTKLDLPIQFGDANSDTYSYLISVPAFGTIGQEGTLNYTVDGWGSLTTPGGTFNTLRVKTTTVKSDTIYINLLSFGLRIPSTEVVYEWYASNEGSPVLTVTEQLGTVTSIIYLDDPTSSVPNIRNDNLSRVYPNPAENLINLTYTASYNLVSIWNITGNRVINIDGFNPSAIDISNLVPGIYFIQIAGNTGVQTKKIIIE